MEVAQEIHVRVKNELGFTVNIGVANNKLLAKMASDFAKPDKIHTLYINEIKQKMWPLSVSELFMLGRRTVPKLQNMQIRTIGDLASQQQSNSKTHYLHQHAKFAFPLLSPVVIIELLFVFVNTFFILIKKSHYKQFVKYFNCL